jgi:hypothetical protein
MPSDRCCAGNLDKGPTTFTKSGQVFVLSKNWGYENVPYIKMIVLKKAIYNQTDDKGENNI